MRATVIRSPGGLDRIEVDLRVGSPSQQQDYVQAIDAGGLRAVMDKTFPLERLAGAFGCQEGRTILE